MDKIPAPTLDPAPARTTQRRRAAAHGKSPASGQASNTKSAVAQTTDSGKPDIIDIDAPEFYLNRELTWLEFNRRVLLMAADEQTPLLERVKFLAIVSGNLDEFFMKRIGGLKQQIAAGLNTQTVDGRTPMEQMQMSQVMVREMHRDQNQIFYKLLELLDAQSDTPGQVFGSP